MVKGLLTLSVCPSAPARRCWPRPATARRPPTPKDVDDLHAYRKQLAEDLPSFELGFPGSGKDDAQRYIEGGPVLVARRVASTGGSTSSGMASNVSRLDQRIAAATILARGDGHGLTGA